jgi:hypothetical protein
MNAADNWGLRSYAYPDTVCLGREAAVRSAMKLVGSRAECDTLDRLVEAVDARYGRAWVMCGQPSVGTTALIHFLIRRSAVQISKTAGYRSPLESAKPNGSKSWPKPSFTVS